MTAFEDARCSAVAARVVHSLGRRGALDEAVGILGIWRGCDTNEARASLLAAEGLAGQDAEAARVADIVDSQAEHCADPDWD